MPTFVCRIGKADGTVLEERLQADDAADAKNRLERRGMVVYAVKPLGTLKAWSPDWIGLSRRISPQEFLVFNQELLVLIKAGLPILRALDLLAARSGHAGFRQMLADVRERVRGGTALADALAVHPRHFSELYVASLRAGERSGNIVEMLTRYQVFMKRVLAVRRKVVSALSYPAFLLAAGAGVIVFLVAFVMPTFLDVYREAKTDLPVATIWLMAAVDFLRHWAVVLAAGIVAVVVAFRLWRRTEPGRRLTDRWWVRSPIVGTIVRTHYTISISRTLATILAGGIPLVAALRMVEDSTPNREMSAHVARVIERVKNGSGLAQAFSVDGFMPRMTLEMIEVGEATGALEEMLNQVAEFHEEELDRALTRISTWIEPAMLLTMGVLVAAVVITMYLPIFNLAGTIK
jgi:type IV pilus assembly protein PilC